MRRGCGIGGGRGRVSASEEDVGWVELVGGRLGWCREVGRESRAEERRG